MPFAGPTLECSQVTCHADATHVFTWPGDFEKPICSACLETARGVVWTFGFNPDVFMNVKTIPPVEGP